MTTPISADQIASEISSLKSRAGWLQDSARLKNTLSAVGDLQTAVNGLPQSISKLRTDGYVFEKALEPQAGNLVNQWGQLYPTLLYRINSESASLQGGLNSIEFKMTQLNGVGTNPAAALPLISALQNDMQLLEDKASSAESTVQGLYAAFNNEFNNFKSHLDEISYLLAQIAEAKFTLLPGEGGLRACKAAWYREVKKRDDDPEGVLYLTDQRLLFEQKEEVATKKILFITTAKQKVQELKWEIPVTLIDVITPSKQGMLKNEDHLDLRFKQGAAIESAHLHIWQPGSDWLKLINRAKTRDFDTDRVVAIDQSEVAKLKTAPSICPSCSANLNQVILRGQDSITCEYCGFVIRL